MIVTRTINQVTVTATRNGISVKVQPVLNRTGEAFDGIVNGGTA